MMSLMMMNLMRIFHVILRGMDGFRMMEVGNLLNLLNHPKRMVILQLCCGVVPRLLQFLIDREHPQKLQQPKWPHKL
jgi:hypothetical protein